MKNPHRIRRTHPMPPLVHPHVFVRDADGLKIAVAAMPDGTFDSNIVDHGRCVFSDSVPQAACDPLTAATRAFDAYDAEQGKRIGGELRQLV